MKLEKTFCSLEEMAQFLRENGYYVSKTAPVEYVPYPVYPVPAPMPTYPYSPITMDNKTEYDGRPVIKCQNK